MAKNCRRTPKTEKKYPNSMLSNVVQLMTKLTLEKS